MRNLCAAVVRFIEKEDGPTAVEYAVMLALILLAMVGTIKALGGASGSMWGSNYTQMKAAGF